MPKGRGPGPGPFGSWARALLGPGPGPFLGPGPFWTHLGPGPGPFLGPGPARALLGLFGPNGPRAQWARGPCFFEVFHYKTRIFHLKIGTINLTRTYFT